MKNNALIFDIDGTLWSASSATAKGWNRALEKLDIPKRVTVAEIESVTGRPHFECVETLLPEWSQKYPDLQNQLILAEIEMVKKEGGVLYPGVFEGMRQLHKAFDLYLVSNCPKWYLDLFMDYSGLGKWITASDCYGLSQLSKGQMLSKMVRDYSLDPCVYIGDTVWDETAAREAGIPFIHVTYGFGKPEGKCRQFDRFGDLAAYFTAEKTADKL